MSDLNSLGLGGRRTAVDHKPNVEHVIVQQPLQRVLAFVGHSIDDVVNNPIVKNKVIGYYKLQRWVERESEISEMEHAWNPLGMRT